MDNTFGIKGWHMTRINLIPNDMNHIYQLLILLALSIGMIYSTQYIGNKNKFKWLRDLAYAIGMVMTVSFLAVFFIELGLTNVIAFGLTVIVTYLLFFFPLDIIAHKKNKNSTHPN